jgi:hypothetical protein
MTRTKRWVLCGVLVAFGIYVVWSGGGIHIENVNDFGGQRNIVLAPGLESDVWLSPSSSGFGVPLLFQYRRISEPFGLRLQIWDTSKQYQSIEVAKVLVEYKDGEVVHITTPWNRNLRPYTQYNSSSSGVSETQMLMLSDEIPNLVLRHADVRITLIGHLIQVDGQRVAFRASEDFETESSIRTATFLEVISSC